MRNTKRKNCHNRDIFLYKKGITIFIILYLLTFPCQTQTQDHVTFWGMELGKDIKEDSIFLCGKGCRAYKNILKRWH